MTGNKPLRILLVDDDRDLLDLLRYNFEKEGFSVRTVTRVNNAIAVLRKFRPDLVVLDVMMPDGNGIDLCRKIRSDNTLDDVHIFILTGRSETYYRDAALDIGADDFIEKLSGIRLLTNKVSAVLKNRFIIRKSVRALSADDITINKRSQVVYLRNEPVTLSKPEFEILFFLMQNPNKPISRKNLIKIIWGSELYIMESSVHNYVESLQRKVGSDRIEALKHDRYRFVHTGHRSQSLR